jgi:hypothetical protein
VITKRIVLVACIAACVLAFRIVDTPETLDVARHWSYADPICAAIAAYCFVKIVSGAWRLDAAAYCLLAFLVATAVSGMVNDAWNNGTFLNFGRTLAWSLVFYVTGNNLGDSDSDYEFAMGAICLLGTIAILYGLIILNEEWDSGFTHLVQDKLANLNLFTFSVTMLLGPLCLWWVAKPLSPVRGGALIVAASAIAVGYSRTAYTCSFVLLFLILATNVRIAKNWIVLAVVCLALGALLYVQSDFASRSEEARQFWQQKNDTYSTDLWDGRVIANFWDPVQEWVEKSDSNLLFGDAVSIQHSILAATIVMTGIMGTALFIIFHIQLFGMGLKQWILARKLGIPGINPGSVFLGVTLITLLNDMATSGRIHALYLALMFGLITGIHAGYLRTMKMEFRRRTSVCSAFPRHPVSAVIRSMSG